MGNGRFPSEAFPFALLGGWVGELATGGQGTGSKLSRLFWGGGGILFFFVESSFCCCPARPS